MDASLREDGVRGALEKDGERMLEGSRLTVEALLNFIGSPAGGDNTAGQRDLSVGNALPPDGARWANIAAAWV